MDANIQLYHSQGLIVNSMNRNWSEKLIGIDICYNDCNVRKIALWSLLKSVY